MNALDRKLLRDVWGMRTQVLAIALVMVAGVATYVSMTSVMNALQDTLDAYYGEYRFPDGFASLRRAPERLHERLRLVPGVGEVQTRITASVNLEIEHFDEPVAGMLVSVPEGRQPVLNRLVVRRGRLVAPGGTDEVLLNETFADAHDFGIGDSLTAVINGRRRTLHIVGIALSPEFLMQVQPGSMFPDPERYGILWMGRESLAAAYDMEGAFNDVAFTLAPGASPQDVIDRIDLLLARYGGMRAFLREDHPSHFMISEEFRQLRGMAALLPVIFLAVAAFLLNIVITRLISLQREQVAVLKAFGYSNVDVGVHYLKLVGVIAFIGAVGGAAIGLWLGAELGQLYLRFFRFPELRYVIQPTVILTAVALTAGASFVGVVRAVRGAVRLPPAEAMRPAPPARYGPTFLERLGLQRLLDQPTRMVLRNLERQPVKALLTLVGVASSCAILVMGLFWTDAIDFIVRVQYGIAQRDDITVTFIEPTSSSAVTELRSLPGVLYAEPFRSIAVRLRHEHRYHDGAVEGVPAGAYLRRIIDTRLQPIPIPPEGIVLTDRLAANLGVAAGDSITVEVLEGRRRVRRVPVAALAQQYLGLAAYMELSALNRMAGDGRAINGAFLATDPLHDDALTQALRDRPRVASIVSQERAIQAYMESAAETLLTFTFVLSLFAGVIAFGVVYNSARITLSERDRELASMRVLGFTKGEVSYILLGELTLLTLLAIPVGLVLGVLAARGIVTALQSDMFQIPVVMTRRTYAMAATIVLTAAVGSALIVRRRVHRLDLVGVLKSRE